MRSYGLTAVAAAVLAAAFCVMAAGHADILHMKDGTRVGGEILSESKALVRVRMNDGKVRTFRHSDIERIEKGVDLEAEVDQSERDRPFMPGLDEDTRVKVREEAERFAGPMRVKLDAAARPFAWVFGDHPQHELSQVAEAVQQTVDDFCDVFECEPEEVLPGRYANQPGQFYCFQFQQEPAYLRFVDKVFDRMRDESVNDERLKLIKRQKGFWIMTPRPLMARYRGPGTQQTIVSNASHQASHALLLMWMPAGDWMPWWLLEGVATWQEIRLTGHNLTYCLEVARPDDYVDEGTPDADELAKAKIAEKWRRHVKRLVRSGDDKNLATLAKLSLNEILFADVQQSWSVVDWLDRKGELKRFVIAYKNARTIDGAFRDAMDMEVEQAYQEWRAWVKKTY